MQKLPGELRNKIYTLALNTNEVIFIGNHGTNVHSIRITKGGTEVKARKWTEPRLFRVSKQVRQEASSIYYSVNRFKIIIPVTRINEVVSEPNCLALKYV